MTTNQIAYWELEEKKRSNREQESQTKPLREAQARQATATATMNYQQANKIAYEIISQKASNFSQIMNIISNVLGLPTWFNTSETRNIGAAAKDLTSAAGNVMKMMG